MWYCNKCEPIKINGHVCHETGCPNIGARFDPQSREWIKQRKCFDCGYMVDIDDPCCQAEDAYCAPMTDLSEE